jgi:hypothetical protein
MTDKIEKFKSILKLVDESISRTEFEKAVASLVEFVKKLKENSTRELETMKIMLKSATAKMENDQTEAMGKMDKGVVAKCEAEMNKMLTEHEAMMSAMDKKIEEVRDGKDGKDGRDGKDGANGLHGSPDTADDILNKISGLLEIEDVKGLKELLEEVKNRKVVGGGGFSLMAMQQHFIPWTETSVAPNGVLTDFVIAYTPNPTNSLEVMVDNSPLFKTSDWTFATSTKTISFLVAPPDGAKIRYKCLI